MQAKGRDGFQDLLKGIVTLLMLLMMMKKILMIIC